MKKTSITSVSADGSRPGKTDWPRVDKLADAEIEEAMRSDADWADFADIDWDQAEVVVPPRKKAISIRIDEDVLAFFKRPGAGYQRRINAVLRGFVRHRLDKAKKRA
jgi:uncharacterized protein (DUF4415 family)